MWQFVVILLRNQKAHCSLILGAELTQTGHAAMRNVGSTRLWVECTLADIKCPQTVVSSREMLGRPPAVVHHCRRRSVTYSVGHIQRVGPSPLV